MILLRRDSRWFRLMVGVLKLDVFKGGVGSENGLEDGRYLIYMFSRSEEVS